MNIIQFHAISEDGSSGDISLHLPGCQNEFMERTYIRGFMLKEDLHHDLCYKLDDISASLRSRIRTLLAQTASYYEIC